MYLQEFAITDNFLLCILYFLFPLALYKFPLGAKQVQSDLLVFNTAVAEFITMTLGKDHSAKKKAIF